MSDFKKKVLLIDDDEEDYQFLKDVFAKLHPDVEIEWCKDGEEAMTLLEEGPGHESLPHVVLLDLNLPKVHGHEILKHMRDNILWKSVPVIISSNTMNEKDRLESARLGANSFVKKASGYEELKSFVESFYLAWF